MQRLGVLSLGLWLCATAGCGQSQRPVVAQSQQANFVNGGFESGDLSSWTVTTNLSPLLGMPTYPPTSVANLGLVAGGTNLTSAQTGAQPESQLASGLTTGDTLSYPKFGAWSTVVNELGKNRNSNTLTQSMTTTQADVDALDGNIHIRFALAPVLQTTLHPQSQQPYYFISVVNTTKNKMLAQRFSYPGQVGVPYKTAVADPGVQYTDWQLFDLAPGPVDLAIGDTVRTDIVASGCSIGDHYGELYVDGFGTFIPSLTVVGSATPLANAGTDLVYTFVVKNGGTSSAGAVVVSDVLPDNTTFVAVNGATCTAPAVGQTGSVTCNLGALNPGAGTTFQLTVHIAPTATGTINNGTYAIEGSGLNPLLGPLVQTSLTAGAVYADLAITATSASGAADWGSPVTYTVVATNNGPTNVVGAVISNPLPAELTGVTWTCVGTSNGVCGAATGTGGLNTTANLPTGGTVTYTVNGTIIAGSGMGVTSYGVSIATSLGVTDPSPGNNNAVAVINLGPTAALSVDKAMSTGAGLVSTSPVGILCGPSCTTQSAKFQVGSAVTLTAVAAAGSTFTGWGGECASAGTAAQCTVTFDQAKNVSATFVLPGFPITTRVPDGHGTVTCPGTAVKGRDAVCTLTPDAGYVLSVVTLDSADITATVMNNRFTISNVQGPHDVQVSFIKDIGNSCSTAADCRSGFCVGGVCCDSACEGACQVCTTPGQVGICSATCGNYACDVAANSCFAGCENNAQCVTGGACADGVCLAPAGGNYTVSGGGLSGCAYGEPKGASASGGLAFLAVLAFLARRRRSGGRVVA